MKLTKNKDENKIIEPFRILFPDFIENIIKSLDGLNRYVFPKVYNSFFDIWVRNSYLLIIKFDCEINLDSFIVKMHCLIEKKGLSWIDQNFNQSLLFERLNTLFWEKQIIYYLFYKLCVCKDGLACVCKFREICKKLCSPDEWEKIKKFGIVFKNFSNEKIGNFLSKMEKETPLILDNYKKALKFCEEKKRDVDINIAIKKFEWLLIQDDDFPCLPDPLRTPEIEEFLIRKRIENKKQYDEFCFREEKRIFLKELAQREFYFWRGLGKETYSLSNSNIAYGDSFFSIFKRELQTGKPAFAEREKLKIDNFWNRAYAKDGISLNLDSLLKLRKMEHGVEKLVFEEVVKESNLKKPNTLLQIAFKKLAEQHGPTSSFFRNFILGTCLLYEDAPECYRAFRFYSSDLRIRLTREGMRSLETNYWLKKRKEKILFHYAWCRKCIGYSFDKNNNYSCPFENSEIEKEAQKILSTWKKRKKEIIKDEVENFDAFFRECTKFDSVTGDLYEGKEFSKGRISTCGINLHQINQKHVDYLKERKKIKKIAFEEAEQLTLQVSQMCLEQKKNKELALEARQLALQVSQERYLEISFDQKINKYLSRSEKADTILGLKIEVLEKKNNELENNVSCLTKTHRETQRKLQKELTESEEVREELIKRNVELKKDVEYWRAEHFFLLSEADKIKKRGNDEKDDGISNLKLSLIFIVVWILFSLLRFATFKKSDKKPKRF